ncbi:hypothetical protein OEZ86_000196 [Tetradesmus obliquus]|nr:hypothetical protein OEZ86_000196 [Tetradesmus obliquus]
MAALGVCAGAGPVCFWDVEKLHVRRHLTRGSGPGLRQSCSVEPWQCELAVRAGSWPYTQTSNPCPG